MTDPPEQPPTPSPDRSLAPARLTPVIGPAARSEGTLLGGRVAYTQHCDGYRTGIEPVLLAAAVPARAGDHVVEGGSGAGAGLLCLAARVPGVLGLALEIDPALAALAAANFAANGQAGLCARVQDVAAWRDAGPFDHAFANPPWHRADATPPRDAGRRLAKVAAGDMLAAWAMRLASGLRRRGTLSLLLPAGLVGQGTYALQAAGCPEISLLPLWPRQGEAARLLLLQGVRGGRGPGRVLPGLVLHEADGRSTPAAEAVLRRAAPLP